MVDKHPPFSNYSGRPLEEVVKGFVATINAAAAIVTEIDVTRFRLGLNRSNQFLKSRNCIHVSLTYLLALLLCFFFWELRIIASSQLGIAKLGRSYDPQPQTCSRYGQTRVW